MNTNLPAYEVYGDYSGNYGVHALKFRDADGNQYWFSYKTLVAFQRWNARRVVLRNYWGPTTGKHLNSIDGGTPSAKAARVDQATFDRMLRECQQTGQVA